MSLYLMHYGVKGMKWGVRRSKDELKAASEKSIREYQELVIKKHDKDLKNGLSMKGDPNSVVDRVVGDGKVIQRRLYDDKGGAIYDFDITDHGRPDTHPSFSHKHKLANTLKNPHLSGVLEFTMKELAYNSDIIQRGKNYFDEKYREKHGMNGKKE